MLRRKALSTLSQKSATVAENGEITATVAANSEFGDSRTFLRQSHVSATVAVFCDSRCFRRQIVAEIRDYSRQCGQALKRHSEKHKSQSSQIQYHTITIRLRTTIQGGTICGDNDMNMINPHTAL